MIFGKLFSGVRQGRAALFFSCDGYEKLLDAKLGLGQRTMEAPEMKARTMLQLVSMALLGSGLVCAQGSIGGTPKPPASNPSQSNSNASSTGTGGTQGTQNSTSGPPSGSSDSYSKSNASSNAGLTPQPLPKGAQTNGNSRTNTASNVALNPQPLPPGKKRPTSALSKVALNPQPLPPGAKVDASKAHKGGKKSKKGGGADTGRPVPK